MQRVYVSAHVYVLRNFARIIHHAYLYHVPHLYSGPSCSTRNKPSFTYPKQADQCMLPRRCAWGERSELGREYTFALLLPVRLARLVMAGCKQEKTGNSSFRSCHLSKYVESCGHDRGRHWNHWTWGTTSSIFPTISSLMVLTYLGNTWGKNSHPWYLIPWFTDVVIIMSSFLFGLPWFPLFMAFMLLYCMYTLYLEVFRVLISICGCSPGLNDLYLTVYNSEDRQGVWKEQLAHQAG